MIRKITMAVLILVTAFAQCCLFQIFEIASVKPNLLLIVTVAFGLMRGRRSGLVTGFFCGLALEILFGETAGFQALIYMWLGYMAGYFYRIFYDDDIKTPLMLVCGADLIYGLYQYVFSFLLRGRIHFFYYLGRVIIPEMLYTLMMTILIYWILYRINHLLNKSDKRRIDSLV